MGPDHVNDGVDLAIMSRNTLKGSDSLISASLKEHLAHTELEWETTVDSDGRGVTGKQAQDRWAAAKPKSEYVLRNSEGRIIEPLQGEYRMAETGVWLPLNRIGEYVSRDANLEHLLRQTLFDEVHGLNPLARDWIKYLAENGYDDGSLIRAIGTRNMKGEASISRDGKTLSASKYLSKWAEEHAKELGIDSYEGRLEYKMLVMLHELGHNRGVYSEYKLGKLMQEFYEKMAEKYEGTDKGRIYRALAKGEKKYAESHKASRFLEYLNLYRKSKNGEVSEADLRNLIEKYTAEGSSRGYRGKALSKYVSKRLKEEAEEEGTEDSSKESKQSKKAADKSDKQSKESEEEQDPEETDGEVDSQEADNAE
jgi:hypothetical protein